MVLSNDFFEGQIKIRLLSRIMGDSYRLLAKIWRCSWIYFETNVLNVRVLEEDPHDGLGHC